MDLSAWSELLLDVLLPLRDEPGIPVVLACDDEALRAAARRGGLDPETAADQLSLAVRREASVDAGSGLNGLYALSYRFHMDRRRPRPTPAFLAPLCLCVLAATRMAPGDGIATNAYYPHLRRLLRLPSATLEVPGMPVVSRLLKALADWLRGDLHGARGHLIISGETHLPYVGPCIDQTVFRSVDRQVLSRFFAAKDASLTGGHDPLLLLRRWPGRYGLTEHARVMTFDTAVEDQVRAAIRSARETWDGSVLDRESGGRSWQARLQLVTRPRLRLLASCGCPTPLRVSMGSWADELAPGAQIELPWAVLAAAEETGRWLGDPAVAGGALRIPVLGNTVLFDDTELGLMHTATPAHGTVWALTRDPALQRRLSVHLAPDERLLPAGWRLLRDVPVAALGRTEAVETVETRPELWIDGGLAVDRRTFLTREAACLCASPAAGAGRMDVFVNGRVIGTIGPGDRLQLPADHEGTYHVVAGHGLYTDTYHVTERAEEPHGIGSLSYHFRRRPLLGGARPTRPDEPERVCGAALADRYRGSLPLMRRDSNSVLIISRDGSGRWYERPTTPTWLVEVGILSPRWAVPTDGAVWVICPGGNDVRLVDPSPIVALTEESARCVVRMGQHVVVRDAAGARAAPAAWLELVAVADRTLA